MMLSSRLRTESKDCFLVEFDKMIDHFIILSHKLFNRHTLLNGCPCSCRKVFCIGGIMNRIGIVGIVIEDLSSAPSVNSILHQYNHLIIGRMGLPYKARGISIISIMVDGTNEEIGSLSGKLGQLKGVTAKTALTKKSYEKERYK